MKPILCRHCLQERSVHTAGWRCQTFEPKPVRNGARRRSAPPPPATGPESFTSVEIRSVLAHAMRYLADVLELNPIAIRPRSPATSAAGSDRRDFSGFQPGPLGPTHSGFASPFTAADVVTSGPLADVARPRSALVREMPDGRGVMSIEGSAAQLATLNGQAKRIGDLSPCASALLVVLAQRRPLPTNARQLAILAFYKPNTGGVREAIRELREVDALVGDRDAINITDEGVRLAGVVPPLPTGPGLLDHWCAELRAHKKAGKCAEALLRAAVSMHPHHVTIDALVERTGYRKNTGGMRGALALLRTYELLDRRGYGASDFFMRRVKGGAS